MIAWDGNERRKQAMQMSQDDRDRFIRMDTNLENLTKSMTTHALDDKAAFKKHGEDIDWLKKLTYLGMGGIFVLNIVFKFIAK